MRLREFAIELLRPRPEEDPLDFPVLRIESENTSERGEPEQRLLLTDAGASPSDADPAPQTTAGLGGRGTAGKRRARLLLMSAVLDPQGGSVGPAPQNTTALPFGKGASCSDLTPVGPHGSNTTAARALSEPELKPAGRGNSARARPKSAKTPQSLVSPSGERPVAVRTADAQPPPVPEAAGRRDPHPEAAADGTRHQEDLGNAENGMDAEPTEEEDRLGALLGFGTVVAIVSAAPQSESTGDAVPAPQKAAHDGATEARRKPRIRTVRPASLASQLFGAAKGKQAAMVVAGVPLGITASRAERSAQQHSRYAGLKLRGGGGGGGPFSRPLSTGRGPKGYARSDGGSMPGSPSKRRQSSAAAAPRLSRLGRASDTASPTAISAGGKAAQSTVAASGSGRSVQNVRRTEPRERNLVMRREASAHQLSGAQGLALQAGAAAETPQQRLGRRSPAPAANGQLMVRIKPAKSASALTVPSSPMWALSPVAEHGRFVAADASHRGGSQGGHRTRSNHGKPVSFPVKKSGGAGSPALSPMSALRAMPTRPPAASRREVKRLMTFDSGPLDRVALTAAERRLEAKMLAVARFTQLAEEEPEDTGRVFYNYFVRAYLSHRGRF